MTYNVFSGTLNPTQSINPDWEPLTELVFCSEFTATTVTYSLHTSE